MKTENKNRVIIDDLGVFLLWESFVAGMKKKPEWQWDIAKQYTIKLGKEPVEKNIANTYRIMIRRLEQYVKLGIFTVECNGEGKKIYYLNTSDITFKKIRFPDKQARALIIRIDN